MKISTRTLAIGTTTLACGILFVARQAQAQFTAGDLVVDRIGSGGATALSSAAAQVYLDDYSTTAANNTNGPAFSLTLTGLTSSGSATSEGFLTRSADGSSLIVPGYNAPVGTASVASTKYNGTPAVARAVGVVNAAGTITSLTTLGTAYSNNNIRGATSTNGSTLFTSGAATGVFTATAGTNTGSASAPTVVTSTSSSRVVDIFNNQLYYSTGSGTAGIYQVGTGTPTSSGQTSTLFLATTANPYAFSISPDGKTVYVADASAGVDKYTATGTGGAFVLAGTFSTGAARGLAVDYGTAGGPTIYFTNQGSGSAASPSTLSSFTDTASSFTVTPNLLATAGLNEVFSGVDFAVPEPATVFGGVLLVGSLGWHQRRRIRPLTARA